MVCRVAALTHSRIYSSYGGSSSGIHFAPVWRQPGHPPRVCIGVSHVEETGCRCSLGGDACMLATMDTQYATRNDTSAVSGRTAR